MRKSLKINMKVLSSEDAKQRQERDEKQKQQLKDTNGQPITPTTVRSSYSCSTNSTSVWNGGSPPLVSPLDAFDPLLSPSRQNNGVDSASINLFTSPTVPNHHEHHPSDPPVPTPNVSTPTAIATKKTYSPSVSFSPDLDLNNSFHSGQSISEAAKHHRWNSDSVFAKSSEASTSTMHGLNQLASELSNMLKDENKKREEQAAAAPKPQPPDEDRKDHLTTLGVSPRQSKIKFTEEDKKRGDRLGVSPRAFAKKKSHRIFSSTKRKDDRIALSSGHHCKVEESAPPPPPSASTPTPSLYTSEYEPSPHQMEISPVDDLLFHARICAILEDYRTIDQNFDFYTLVNSTRMHLSHRMMHDNAVHKPILHSIVECMGQDDVVIRDFVKAAVVDKDEEEGITDEGVDCHGRMEVCIWVNETSRKIIVCWRGGTKRQLKPVRKREMKMSADKAVPLHPDQPKELSIFPPFKTQVTESIENKVLSSLSKLTEEHPFFDVVMIGHSYGGALALLSASRYAISFPMMRVYCHVFGNPKVACSHGKLRDLVHSLPNLKILRIEQASDPYVHTPEGSAWTHVGHTIRMAEDSVKAYKFDKHRSSNPMEFFIKQHYNKKNWKKQDNPLHSYVHALERFTHRGIPWVTTFAGEQGNGLIGKNEEKRLLV